MLGSRRRPTIKTKNNKTELLNPEEGEDNMGDAVGKKLIDQEACKRVREKSSISLMSSYVNDVLFTKVGMVLDSKKEEEKEIKSVKLKYRLSCLPPSLQGLPAPV